MPGRFTPPRRRGTTDAPGDPVVFWHRAAVTNVSGKYHIPKAVLYAILSVEGGTDSKGRPVKPADGAGPASYGQFTYATGKSLGVKYGSSSSEVDAIARYLLKNGYDPDEDPDSDTNRRAIASYNGGPGNPQYSYADKVLGKVKSYSVNNPVVNAVSDTVEAAMSIPKFLGKLDVIFDAGFWRRVGLVLLGVAAFLLGGVLIGKEFTPIGAIAKTFKKG